MHDDKGERESGTCSNEAGDDDCGGGGTGGGGGGGDGAWRQEQERDAQDLIFDAGGGDRGLDGIGGEASVMGGRVEEVAESEEQEAMEVVGRGRESAGTSAQIGEGVGSHKQSEDGRQGTVVNLCDEEEEEDVVIVPSSPLAIRQTTQTLFGVAATKTPETLRKGKVGWGSLGNWKLPSGPGPVLTAAQGSGSGGGAASAMMKVMRPLTPGGTSSLLSCKRSKSATAKARPKENGKPAKGSMDAFVRRL